MSLISAGSISLDSAFNADWRVAGCMLYTVCTTLLLPYPFLSSVIIETYINPQNCKSLILCWDEFYEQLNIYRVIIQYLQHEYSMLRSFC
jgi:hypothetical protein